MSDDKVELDEVKINNNKNEEINQQFDENKKEEADSINLRPTTTLLLYLNDAYKFESDALVLDCGTDQKGNFLILDQTIFYPQSGGQPSDTGTISLNDSNTFNVHFVSFSNEIVRHYVKENVNDNLKNQRVVLKIDENRRLLNAKSHTAGHLLASVVEQLANELIGIKGHHFPDGPYVEFNGKLTSLSIDELIQKAVCIFKEKISNQTRVSASTIANNSQNELLNTDESNKKSRIVQIEGFPGVPCGGTHLNNLSQLKELSIRKIQFPKGNTKISYTFS